MMDDEDLEALLEDEMDIVREMENEERDKETKYRKRLFNDEKSNVQENDDVWGLRRQNSEILAEKIDPPEKKSKTSDYDDSIVRIPRLGERKIYRRIPRDSEYQSVTSVDSTGERYYLRLKPELDESEIKTTKGSVLNVLPYPVLLEEALLLKNRLNDFTEAEIQDENASSALWVEKFRPKHFPQLLSDDGTNRVLLKWLKLWDKIVFNKEIKKKKPQKPEEKKFGKIPELEEDLDETNRPVQKVALLHGPPGLGKTTLGHVIANHAGYNPVEMNASDDRSLSLFKTNLDSATRMRSLGKDRRPNCLIIDEIDGSPSAVINYLVNFIDNNKKKKKLQRPILCICNDLYVPALRPLRKIALVVPFPPTCSARLTQRLSQIIQQERLKSDSSALLALCEKTQNDIRACLSTLQFFKSRGNSRIRLSDVQKTSVGLKDSHKSHFAVWNHIFQVPNNNNNNNNNNNGSRFSSILKTVYACGDYDRVLQGVFHNYPDIKFKDSGFRRINRGHDWFLFFDRLQNEISHSQNYSLMAYLPFTFAAAHFLFSGNAKPSISYPSVHQERNKTAVKSAQLVTSLLEEMTSPYARIFVNSLSVLVRDFLPCLIEIVRPVLRSVNVQLFSAKEKETFKNLVRILVTYNLTYQQERSPDGQYTYRFDPDVTEVVHYPGIKHYDLPYALKQMISYDVNKERMRNFEPTITHHTNIKEKINKPVKKEIKRERSPTDFFGRKIPKVEKSSEYETNEIVKSDIWFKFNEGYNNAVRRTVKMDHLL